MNRDQKFLPKNDLQKKIGHVRLNARYRWKIKNNKTYLKKINKSSQANWPRGKKFKPTLALQRKYAKAKIIPCPCTNQHQ